MNTQQSISEFGNILLFFIGGLIFILGGLGTAWAVRAKRPNEEKNTTYESCEDPVGSAWAKFNVRFYIIAIIFILFEVEIVFLFPWAIIFGNKELIEGTHGLWGWFSIIEVFMFIFILALGLVYAWAKGHLEWIRPEIKVDNYKSPVPSELYKAINKKQHAS